MEGPDVRSDCRVTVWLPSEGAPERAINSRVAALYGRSIRALVHTTLAALEATDLSLSLEDSGALPYVLQARVEAAVRRLRPGTAASALPPTISIVRPKDHAGWCRSRLYLPGNMPKFMINAGLHRPDAVILDLEDSVSPEEKDAALVLVRNALRAVDFYGAEKMVRVNALPAGLDEMRVLAPHGVDTFILPKVDAAETVQIAADLLEQEGHSGVGLLPLIENARGVLNAYAIASVSPRVRALAIGLEDYTADINAQRTEAGRESLWAQSQVVNSARAAGVQPLASVYSAVTDEAGFRRWLAAARELGFAGAGCLHPSQIRAVHAAFAPSSEEIAHARKVMEAFDTARSMGHGVLVVDDQMVDIPVVERARQILRLAERA